MRLFSVVLIVLILSSCGIPQISPPPFSVEMRRSGTEFSLDFGPSDTAYTRGFIILYGIFQLENTSDYSSIASQITSQQSPANAYSSATNQGFTPVQIQGISGTPLPTVDVQEYKSLFGIVGVDTVIDGFDSEIGQGIFMRYNSLTGLRLYIDEPPSSVDETEFILKRSTGEDFLSTNINSGDSDIRVISSSGNYYLAFVVIGFNSNFTEGVKYSFPDVSSSTDLMTL